MWVRATGFHSYFLWWFHSLSLTSLKWPVFPVQFSLSVMSDSLQPHGLQHARFPCPSPTPRACSNSCPSSWWRHPTILSSVSLVNMIPITSLEKRSASECYMLLRTLKVSLNEGMNGPVLFILLPLVSSLVQISLLSFKRDSRLLF